MSLNEEPINTRYTIDVKPLIDKLKNEKTKLHSVDEYLTWIYEEVIKQKGE